MPTQEDFSYEIDNFIGVFNNVLSKEDCEEIIKSFEHQCSKGLSFDRGPNESNHRREDESMCENINSVYIPPDIAKRLTSLIWEKCHPLYAKQYSILDKADKYTIFEYKIQRTHPGQGYHIWHYETMGRPQTNRVLVYTLYLNDVEEGGETEFLYANRRLKPKAGTFVLFPANFTHTHRGNPPLSGTKYMLTGWMEH